MAGERTFLVKFISDTLGFNKGIKKVSDDVNGIGGQLKKLVPSFKTVAIAGTAAFGAVAATSIKLVNMASDLEESQSKVNTVFGESAQVVNDFAKKSAVSFGITRQAALEAAGTFGNLIQAFGIGRGQAAEMSTTLLGLAADLASFNNTPIEQAIEALRSGLSGEAEPLKRFGIAINDVRLKQEALNLGLYDGKGALDISAKTQASYALILKDTSLAQGDFERTSDGFSNQMRILKASLSDAATELGIILLPYFRDFVRDINENMIPAIKVFVENLKEKGLTGALKAFVSEMGLTGAKVKLKLLEMQADFYDFVNGVNQALKLISLPINILFATINTIAGTELKISTPAETQKQLDDVVAALEKQKQLVDDLSIIYNENNRRTRSISAESSRWTSIAKSLNVTLQTSSSSTTGLGGATSKTSKSIKTASDKLKEYGDALKKATGEQESFSRAQKSESKALTSLTDANDRLAKAKANLAQIEGGFGVGSPQALAAQKELDKAQRSQERATYAVEEAIYSVADAEKNLADVRKDPESSPMDVRRAELNLAEAKLSVKDAIDSQIDSTKELNDQQTLLNETVFGATIGSILYDEALKDVTDATRDQVSAFEAWEEQVKETKNAQDEFNKSLQATADLIAKYPKVLGGMPNPMAGVSGQVPVTAGGGFALRPNDTYQININSAIAEQGLPQKVVEALQQYNRSVGKVPVKTK
jgi:hypothetical protein